jgi:hypothetical protein
LLFSVDGKRERERGEDGDLRAAVCEDHQPGLEGVFGPGDGGDAGAEGEAFEGFCEVVSYLLS